MKVAELTLVSDLEQGTSDSAAVAAASSEFWSVFGDGHYWALGLGTELHGDPPASSSQLQHFRHF